MFSLIDAIRNKSYRRRHVGDDNDRVANLEPDQRQAVAAEIMACNRENDAQLKELDQELEVAQTQLHKAEESEEFVGMRVETYRQLLDKQVLVLERKVSSSTEQPEKDDEQEETAPLTSNNNNTPLDEETGQSIIPLLSEEEHQRQVAKLLQQQAALSKADVAHQKLICQIRELKKSILVLQYKRNEITGMQQEQTDFLVATAEAQEQDNNEQQTNMYMLPVDDEEQEQEQGVGVVVEEDETQASDNDEAAIADNLDNLHVSTPVDGVANVVDEDDPPLQTIVPRPGGQQAN